MDTWETAKDNNACATCLALAIMLDDHPHYEENFTLQWLSEERFITVGEQL